METPEPTIIERSETESKRSIDSINRNGKTPTPSTVVMDSMVSELQESKFFLLPHFSFVLM